MDNLLEVIFKIYLNPQLLKQHKLNNLGYFKIQENEFWYKYLFIVFFSLVRKRRGVIGFQQ